MKNDFRISVRCFNNKTWIYREYINSTQHDTGFIRPFFVKNSAIRQSYWVFWCFESWWKGTFLSTFHRSSNYPQDSAAWFQRCRTSWTYRHPTSVLQKFHKTAFEKVQSPKDLWSHENMFHLNYLRSSFWSWGNIGKNLRFLPKNSSHANQPGFQQ